MEKPIVDAYRKERKEKEEVIESSYCFIEYIHEKKNPRRYNHFHPRTDQVKDISTNSRVNNPMEEQSMKLRPLLIKLFDELSDTDRRALHFAFGNDIPRIYRDRYTPLASQQILENLFDRNLITEQNCDYLIRIFEKIHCHNVAIQLKGLFYEILFLHH